MLWKQQRNLCVSISRRVSFLPSLPLLLFLLLLLTRKILSGFVPRDTRGACQACYLDPCYHLLCFPSRACCVWFLGALRLESCLFMLQFAQQRLKEKEKGETRVTLRINTMSSYTLDSIKCLFRAYYRNNSQNNEIRTAKRLFIRVSVLLAIRIH